MPYTVPRPRPRWGNPTAAGGGQSRTSPSLRPRRRVQSHRAHGSSAAAAGRDPRSRPSQPSPKGKRPGLRGPPGPRLTGGKTLKRGVLQRLKHSPGELSPSTVSAANMAPALAQSSQRGAGRQGPRKSSWGRGESRLPTRNWGVGTEAEAESFIGVGVICTAWKERWKRLA